MSYISDQLVKALGGSKLIGAEGMDYGNWSPQVYRTVGITADCIFVEYHPAYNKGKIVITPLIPNKVISDLQGSGKKYILSAFEHKKFQGLEELLVDQQLGIDPSRFLAKIDHKARLRQVTLIGWTQEYGKLLAAQGASLRAAGRFELLSTLLKVPVVAKAAGPGYRDWYARYSLAPSRYNTDRKDSPLVKYFDQVAEYHGVKVEKEETALSPKQMEALAGIANAVVSDSRKLPTVETLMGLRAKLGKSPHQNAGYPELRSGLKSIVTSHKGTQPGIGYYLREYRESHSVSPNLISVYSKLKFIDESEEEPSRRMPPNDGWLIDEGAVKRVFQSVYRSRTEKHRFVPDRDKLSPTLENIQTLCRLVAGGHIDYLGMSADLKAIDGGEWDRWDPSLVEGIDGSFVDRVCSSFGNARPRNLDFYRAVIKGAVKNENYYVYPSSEGSVSPQAKRGAKDALTAAVITAGRESGWGGDVEDIVAGFFDGSNSASEVLAKALDYDSNRSGADTGEEVDPAHIAAVEDWGGPEALGIALTLVEDACAKSSLKKRQIMRQTTYPVSLPGIVKYSGGKYGGILKRIGLGDISLEKAQNGVHISSPGVLNPGKFYVDLITDMAKLSDKIDYDLVDSLGSNPGLDSLRELDKVARSVLGC